MRPARVRGKGKEGDRAGLGFLIFYFLYLFNYLLRGFRFG